MNHWLNNSKQNLLPLSQSDSFKEALKEWFFTGTVDDYDEDDVECELCEHPDLSHHYEIKNRLTDNKLLVGSKCILKFQEIEVRDSRGQILTEKDERESQLRDALRSKLIEVCLEPLRKLWLKDKPNRGRIKPLALKLKTGSGISPNDLLFLFLRIESHGVSYNPKRYKLSLRSGEERMQLSSMSRPDQKRVSPALSPQQRIRMSPWVTSS